MAQPSHGTVAPPPPSRGFCIWLTGLPSSGKTTIAKELAPAKLNARVPGRAPRWGRDPSGPLLRPRLRPCGPRAHAAG